jgi:hypothetical protein
LIKSYQMNISVDHNDAKIRKFDSIAPLCANSQMLCIEDAKLTANWNVNICAPTDKIKTLQN